MKPNQYRPVEVIHDLSPKDFVKNYRNRSRPVILTSFAKDWPALSNWSPELLKTRYGSLRVPVYDGAFGVQGKSYLHASGSMRFDEYLDLMMAGPTDKRLFLFRLLDAAPELKRDLLFPEGYGRFNRRHVFLFFGGAGSTPTFHYDVDLPHVFHTVLYGRKRVILFAPDQSRKLYQHPFTVRSYVDVTKPDYTKFPRFRDATGYECVLTKGQTLFIPSGFWHQIIYKTGTYAVSYRQYEWRRIPRGLYNMFVRETIDTVLNRVAPSRWFEWKTRRAERRAR